MLIIHSVGDTRDAKTCKCVCAEACGFELLSASADFGAEDSFGLCATRSIWQLSFIVQLYARYQGLKIRKCWWCSTDRTFYTVLRTSARTAAATSFGHTPRPPSPSNTTRLNSLQLAQVSKHLMNSRIWGGLTLLHLHSMHCSNIRPYPPAA